MKYNVYLNRNDLIISKKKKNINKDFYVSTLKKKENIYKTIFFNDLKYVEDILTKEIINFFSILNINKSNHIFIVGLGNENFTADSIGPKVLKHIKVNSYLENLGIKIVNNKVSALEPGVLGETGILTEKIIESVSNEIKPDLIILIDSIISNDINYLNKTIQINNVGISHGSGIKGLNNRIDKDLLNVPIIGIGVTSAIEIKFKNSDTCIPYLLSTNDIDIYVYKISKIIGNSINKAIESL